MHQVATIPTTLSGKKLELPVKKILLGGDPDQVASRGALKDPACARRDRGDRRASLTGWAPICAVGTTRVVVTVM